MIEEPVISMPVSTTHKAGFQQALIQAITKNAFDFIAVAREADQVIVYVNEMGARLFEYDHAADIIGMHSTTLRKKNIEGFAVSVIKNEILERGYFSDEVEYVTKSGVTFWGRVQFNAFEADGTDYMLIQIEKIDRAKFAEENLVSEKKRFGALLEYASIGVVIANHQEEIVLMNPFALQMFGYEMSGLKGKKIETLLPARFRSKHQSYHEIFFTHPLNRSRGEGIDLLALKSDGTEFPIEVSLGNYRSGDETFIISFMSDITIRKKNEDQIKKLNAELEAKVKLRTDELADTISKLEKQIRETEEAEAELVHLMHFQKAVLDSSGAIVIATDPTGIISLFNSAAEDLLGYQSGEVIGIKNAAIFHDIDEVVQRAVQLSGELKEDIQPGFETFVARSRHNLENTHEWTYIRKNGSHFPVSLTVTALRNEQNEITGFLGVAVDISEIKKTEEELQKALEKEKELGELKSRFVSMASHEFRTPLSTVLSSTYLLQKYSSSEDQPKREKHIERIVSSVNLLTDILNDFLSVGKIEEGKVAAKFNLFNIADHISNFINEIRSLQKKGQDVKYLHMGELMVCLDPSLLMHIVMNLLSNAIKFSPEDSVIEIETQVTKNRLILKVKDQGIGISKEDQLHLAERFFRGANVTHIQGTGLGLHIVKKYTELMNGKLVCNSEKNRGTEFIIQFKL